MTPDYSGDAAFGRLLAELSCPMPVHQVKALVMGCVSAPGLTKPGDLIMALWGGQGPNFDSEEQAATFAGNLLGLWNEMASYGDERRYRLAPLALPVTSSELAHYAEVRREEILGFVRGLELGPPDQQEPRPRAMEAFKTLAEADNFLEGFQRLAHKGEEPDDRSIAETCFTLQQLDAVVAQCFSTISAEHIPAHGQRTRPAAARPRRNDQCPCGSGRKYKVCCGRE